MTHEFEIGETAFVPEKPDPKVGSGERFTGGKQSRRDEASEEFAESVRDKDKDTKD